MAFTYGGITYHTDEQDPNPLRNLITGTGLPGSGSPSYYAPVDYSQYLIGGGAPTGTAGGEGGMSGAGGPSINWDALPNVMIGGRPVSASNLAAVAPGVNLFNPAFQTNDKNYGNVTSIGNVNNAQWSDWIGPAIGIAMGAGFGALNPADLGIFGSIGANLPKIAQGFDTGGAQGGAAAALPQLLNVLRNW
jgi:hypothetical protein